MVLTGIVEESKQERRGSPPCREGGLRMAAATPVGGGKCLLPWPFFLPVMLLAMAYVSENAGAGGVGITILNRGVESGGSRPP